MKKALGLLISGTIIISPVWADGATEERSESAIKYPCKNNPALIC